MSNTEKQSYFHLLEDIEEHVAIPEISTEEFLDSIDRWRELSVLFYEQEGIEGKLLDSWTQEGQIDAMTAVLDGVDLEKETEDCGSAEEFVEKMCMELCDDMELSDDMS